MKVREFCKRSLAIVLAPCMVMALLPAIAFAVVKTDGESPDTSTATISTATSSSSAKAENNNSSTSTEDTAADSLSALAVEGEGAGGGAGGAGTGGAGNLGDGAGAGGGAGGAGGIRSVEVPVSIVDAENAPISISDTSLLCAGVTIDGQNAANGKVMLEDKAHRVGICLPYGTAVSKVDINGTEYTQIPEDNEGWIYFDNVPNATSYTIKLFFGDSDKIAINWSYDGVSFGTDAQVENGKVEVVSIERDGNVVYPGNGDGVGVDTSADGGYVQLKKGDDVTLRLIPDYGYQLKSVSANELDLTPQSQVSTFELRNLQGNIHFSSIFEKSENIITTESEFVKGASIANGENAASSGNLSLTVADAPDYSVDVSGALEDPNAEKVTSLDLTLENVVSKGNGSDWTTNITEFPDPITVSMDVPDELAEGQTYGVVRDHNGQLTELPCTYANGVLSFETNMFSTYTIVKQAVKSGENSSKKSPKTGVDSTPLTAATLVFGLIALGTGIYLMRTRRDE